MKFSIEWIKEYLDTNASTQEICDTLNKIGFETNISYTMQNLSQYIVVQIEKIEKHFNADKLNICTVNTGNEKLKIVCGAKNVKEGMYTIFAPIGTLLPSGMEIKKANIRGFESVGMLCAFSEIGVENFYESDGIANLENDTAQLESETKLTAGRKFSETEYAKYISDIIDIEFTSNRRDAANVMSIATELYAAGIGNIKQKEDISHENSLKTLQKHYKQQNYINLKSQTSLFSCCQIQNVQNRKSPLFIEARLRSSEIKVISCLVDITNYIAHEIGRPLHAFDSDKLEGKITLCNLFKNEKFTSLKDEEIEIPAKSLVIQDETKIISLAGIMGAMNSCSEMDTQNVLIESAYFDYKDIIFAGRKTNLQTHARYRFEKGANKEIVLFGLIKAINMVRQLCGGEVAFYDVQESINTKSTYTNTGTSTNTDTNAGENTQADQESRIRKILLSTEKIFSISGIKIDTEFALSVLQKLGFICKSMPESIQNEKHKTHQTPAHQIYEITVPQNRIHDIYNDADIVEEVLRFYGYDNISAIPLPTVNTRKSMSFENIQTLKKLFTSLGYNETITWSFTPYSKEIFEFSQLISQPPFEIISQTSNPAKEDKKKDTKEDTKEENTIISIENPISSDMSYMRQSMLHAMISNISYNRKLLIPFKGFGEIANIYRQKMNQIIEEPLLSLCFNLNKDNGNILAFKSDVISILIHYIRYIKNNYSINHEESVTQNIYMKNINDTIVNQYINGAAIFYKSHKIGYIGVLEEKITQEENIAICEINLSKLNQSILNLIPSLINHKSGIQTDSGSSTEADEHNTNESINESINEVNVYSTYQTVQRDYCFKIFPALNIEKFISQIESKVSQKHTKIVKNVRIFDLFSNENENNEKETYIGIRFTLQHDKKTFSENDLNEIQKTIIDAAKKEGVFLKFELK